MKRFENREVRRMFGRMTNVATVGWRKLHGEMFHNLYSPYITRMIKSRRIRWTVNAARMWSPEMSANC